MKTVIHKIRSTSICLITAVAIAVPGLASARLGDRVRAGIQTVHTGTNTLITNVQQHQPLANANETIRGPAAEIFDAVKQLQVVDQLKQTIGLVQYMQADYDYFSGGQGCSATCASFLDRLKNVFGNFAQLVLEIPALSSESGLIENMQRVSGLIDHLPPRALYLLWQTLSAKMDQLEAAADEIRQTLANLPPLQPVGSFGTRDNGMSTMSVGTTVSGQASNFASNVSDSYCNLKNKEDDPWVKMVRARLELFGWTVEQFEGMIPDVEVKALGGGTAGVAVANASANAGVGVKPTDGVKLLLKLVAYIPQRISKSIEMNILQANVLCQ
jgi:hypothetical protein